MKACLFSLLLMLNTLVFCQDWQPFPYMQKSYYTTHDSTELLFVKIDSLLVGDTSTTYYNFRKPQFPFLGSDSCYGEISELSGALWYIDSFVLTAEAFYLYVDIDEHPFVLYIDTILGTSWTINSISDYSDFEYITITYDSIGTTEIYGLTDSIKYYSISVDAVLPGANQIDDIIIKLSKKYGFLELYNFGALLSPSDCDCNYVTQLSGLINGTDTLGSGIPKWSDWWQMQPGDILKFKSFNNWTGYSNYYLETISHIDKYEDSVVVYYSDGLGGEYSKVNYKNAFQYIMESPPGAVTYAPLFEWDSTYYNDDFIAGGVSQKIFLDNNQLPGTLIQRREVNASWELADSEYCGYQPPFENGIYFDFNSYCGLTGYKTCSSDFGCNGYFLVGSILSGVNYGNVTVAELEAYKNRNQISIFPNPATNFININYIDIESNKITYCIFNSSGFKVAESKLNSNEINISDLLPGIYYIQLISQSGAASKCFVKL